MKPETEIESVDEDTNEVDESDDTLSDSKVSPEDQAKWKKLILGIDNRKLLDFICTLAEARRSIGRADHQVSKKDEKPDKNGNMPYSDSYNAPAQMKPIFPEEQDNPDEG